MRSDVARIEPARSALGALQNRARGVIDMDVRQRDALERLERRRSEFLSRQLAANPAFAFRRDDSLDEARVDDLILEDLQRRPKELNQILRAFPIPDSLPLL